MVNLIPIKPIWLPKDAHKSMDNIILTLSLHCNYSPLDSISNWHQECIFCMMIKTRKSTSRNLLNLMLRMSNLIWYILLTGPCMASSNHRNHGLGVFKLSSNNLESYGMMLTFLHFTSFSTRMYLTYCIYGWHRHN